MRRTLLLVWVAGCSGEIQLPSLSELATVPSTETSPTQLPPPAAVSACLAERSWAEARVWRLNWLELVETFGILGGEQAAAAARSLETDSRPYGFSTSADVRASAAWVEGLHRIAEPVATAIVAQARAAGAFASCADSLACARSFLKDFGAVAWRRPLEGAELDALAEIYSLGREVETVATAQQRFDAGLGWAVRAALQSVWLTYRTELGAGASGPAVPLTNFEIASALSYALLARPPDPTLAAAEDLSNSEARLRHAHRIISEHPAAWEQQLRRFALEWTETNLNATAWEKKPTTFPLFTAALKASMAREADAMADDWVRSGTRLSDFFLAQNAFIDQDNAAFYGRTSSSAVAVKTTVAERRGFLTLPAFLGTHADTDSGSPVLRGSLVLRRFLCLDLPPPPGNVPPLPAVTASTARTTRERFLEHTRAAARASCHKKIDPMGLSLENFDGLGAWRTEENGVAVDASGAIVGSPSSDQPLSGADALATALATSADVKLCVGKQSLRYLLGRHESALDGCALERAQQALTATGTIEAAFLALVADPAFVTRNQPGAQP
jgi:hypothetical protein